MPDARQAHDIETMRLPKVFPISQKVFGFYSRFRHDYAKIRHLQVFKIFKKVFCFYFKFPYSYNLSTQRFHTNCSKDLLYSFYLTELIIIVSIILILLELINIAYAETFSILPVVLLLVSFILLTFDFASALAIFFRKREIVAFLNDLIRQVELLEEGRFLTTL